MHSHKANFGQTLSVANAVLILVLMEDALAQRERNAIGLIRLSLNPCSNGRCTRTSLSVWAHNKGCRLNPCSNGRCTRTSWYIQNYKCSVSLNPCSNGRCTRTCQYQFVTEPVLDGLNPCSNGRCTRTVAFVAIAIN